ncbi:MAG: HTH-type transcriptional activator RhaR [Verrucomicrobiae bacterium]|nr:HTH-type transcriptional activator RhaR [Verrucomicrobiae bacterium]
MLAKYLELLRSGHFSNMPHHYMRRQRPMDYLLFWVLAGHGFVETDSQHYAAAPGDLYCLRRGVPHAYGAAQNDPWDIVWVHFSGSLARSFVDEIRRFGGARVALGQDADLRSRWLELVIFHTARRPHHETRSNTGLYALLGHIIYRLQTKRIADANPFDVARLQTYIHNHLRGTITVDELARQANLSTPHFNRVFRQLFSVSPMQYVLQTRVALASSLLTETALPLKQIGASVGCADPYYFSRLFKKMTGVNPSAYRLSGRRSSKDRPPASETADRVSPGSRQ